MKTVRSFPMMLVALLATVALSTACASGGGSAAEEAAMPVPAGSPFSKIELGMSEHAVRKVLGEPDDANAYMTGKAFIPYYYGTDTARTDWLYKGQGRIVFSRNRYTGALKVIRVLYNPADQAL